MNWRTAKIPWARKTDAEIAAEHGLTRQSVSAARKRLGAPASPAGHGGARHGSGRRSENEIVAACRELTPEQVRKVLSYIRRLK